MLNSYSKYEHGGWLEKCPPNDKETKLWFRSYFSSYQFNTLIVAII